MKKAKKYNQKDMKAKRVYGEGGMNTTKRVEK